MAQQADENQFLSGLSADIFAGQGVDDAALQELLKVLGSRGYLPQVGGQRELVVEETAEQKRAHEEQLKGHHGLSELCRLRVAGQDEGVFRLSELFVPRPEDYQVRAKMDRYNKSRMPQLRQTVQQEDLDQRKRNIKADLKRAGDKLRQQASSGRLPEVMAADLHYLHRESLTAELLEAQNRHRYENCKHIARVTGDKQPTKKTYLEQRRKLRSPVLLEEEIREAVPQEEEKHGPVYLEVDQKSHVMQQIEQNLLEIEKIKEMTTDHKKVREKRELAEQVQQVRARIGSIRGEGSHDVLSQLTPQERRILRRNFDEEHQDKMRRSLPPLYSMTETEKNCFEFAMDLDFTQYSIKGEPSQSKSQGGEASMFEPSRILMSLSRADAMATGSGGQQKEYDDLDKVLSESLFADLFDGSLIQGGRPNFEQGKLAAPTTTNKFQDAEGASNGQGLLGHGMGLSQGDDDIVQPSRDGGSDEGDSERLSCLGGLVGGQADRVAEDREGSAGSSVQARAEAGGDRTPLKVEPQVGQDGDDGARAAPALAATAQGYRILERDNRIRNALVENKYERLREANRQAKGVKLDKVDRRKYWGELRDGDSQNQVDKDFARLTFLERRLPFESRPGQPFFSVEPISDRSKGAEKAGSKADPQQESLKTKYGTLALCGAHPNNFKIDDIREYEFVQKQRAYLYDPLYIKASAQFKSFSSLVGFGSFMNRTSSQKVQKTFDRATALQNLFAGSSLASSEPPNQLEKAPAVQRVLHSLEQGASRTGEVDLSRSPQSLLQYDFREAEAPIHQLDHKKQRQIRQNEEILSKITDDFDQMTDNVKLKKFEEYIQRKNDENRKNAQNNKNRNQSTAYRPTDPRPMSRGPSQVGEAGGHDLTADGSQSQRQMHDGPGAAWLRPGSTLDPKSQEGRAAYQENTGDSYMQPEDIANYSNLRTLKAQELGSGPDGGDHPSLGHSGPFGAANPGLYDRRGGTQGDGYRDSLEPRGGPQNEDRDDTSENSFSEIREIEKETFERGLNQNAGHAQCILDLSYTNFKWDPSKDFARFHRPDIQSHFNEEREVELRGTQSRRTMDKRRRATATLRESSTHVSIGPDGSQTRTDRGGGRGEADPRSVRARLPVTVVDRATIQSKSGKKAAANRDKDEDMDMKAIRSLQNMDEHFKDRIKLSLRDGKFCIFEHVDQNPIFVNNFGMVSKLDRYMYNDRALPAKHFLPTGQNSAISHMGPFGRQKLCRPTEKLPLLGNIDKSLFQGITVLSNKLYRAPVFFHKAKHTDFFCSHFQEKKKGKGKEGRPARRIIIREIQSVYSVGQIEPSQYVWNPQSRNYQTYIKEHAQAYIIRFLQERADNRVLLSDISQMFPLPEQMIKKFIKEISVEVDKQGWCTYNDREGQKQLTDVPVSNLITPEKACRYESAQFGAAMLKIRGIKNITNGDKISYASNKYCSEQRDPLKQKISKFIENEILCTPWNLSSNFCTIHQNQGMLMIRGVGDPSNNHGGFSFLKMPLKISNDCFKDCEKIRRQLNPAMQNPKSVTGTDADLRKLKKNDIFKMLVEMGFQRAELEGLSRWDMVGHLRQHSSNNASTDDKKTARYARGIRYTAKTQREMYHKQVDELFKTQMIYLTGRHQLQDESDYEDPCDQFTIPAFSHNNHDDEALDPAGDELFSQSDPKKFMIEIADPAKISELCQESGDLSPRSGALARTMTFTTSITNITDIPNYKRLLLANNVLNQSPSMQTGPQNLINIGSNSGPQQDNIMTFKNAEQSLQKKLDEKDMTLKCRVLKKIIKNEEDTSKIERIEFNSDSKAIKKFKKRQVKNKYKSGRQRKIGLRDKVERHLTEASQEPGLAAQRPQAASTATAQALDLQQSLQNATSQNQVASSGQHQEQGTSQDAAAAAQSNPFGLRLSVADLKAADSAIDDQKAAEGNSKSRNPAASKKPNASTKKVTHLAQIQGQPIDQLLKGQEHQSYDGQFKKPLPSRKGGASKSNSRQREGPGAPDLGKASLFQSNQDGEVNISARIGAARDGVLGTDMPDFSSQPAGQNQNSTTINIDLGGLCFSMDDPQATNTGENPSSDAALDNAHDQDEGFVINAAHSQADAAHLDEEGEVDEDYMPEMLPPSQPRKQVALAAAKKPASKRNDRKSRVAYKPDTSAALLRQQQQEDDQYRRQNQSSRRARQGGLPQLNAIILEIIEASALLDPHALFRDRVRREIAPNYDVVIRTPMWLGLMRQKCGRQEYRDVTGFKQDMEQMKRNAETYNGRAHPIAELALSIETKALALADARREAIDEATSSIVQFM